MEREWLYPEEMALKLDTACDILKRVLPQNELVISAFDDIVAVSALLKSSCEGFEDVAVELNDAGQPKLIVSVFADISQLDENDAAMFRSGYVLNNVKRIDDDFGEHDLAPIEEYLNEQN